MESTDCITITLPTLTTKSPYNSWSHPPCPVISVTCNICPSPVLATPRRGITAVVYGKFTLLYIAESNSGQTGGDKDCSALETRLMRKQNPAESH